MNAEVKAECTEHTPEAYDTEECDQRISDLQKRCEMNFPYETNKNGDYFFVWDGQKLNIPLSGDQLCKVHERTLAIINLFNGLEGQKDNYTYRVDSGIFDKWWHGGLTIELKHFFEETTQLTPKTLKKMFGDNSQTKSTLGQYVAFLNTLTQNTRRYNNEFSPGQALAEVSNTVDHAIEDAFGFKGKKLGQILPLETIEENLAFMIHLLRNGIYIEAGLDMGELKRITGKEFIVKINNSNATNIRTNRKISFSLVGDEITITQEGWKGDNINVGSIKIAGFQSSYVINQIMEQGIEGEKIAGK